MTKRTMRCPHKDKVSDCKECMAILNPTPPPYDEEQTIRDILCDLLATGRVIGKERPITPDEWEKHILGSEAALQAVIQKAAERQFQESSKDFLETLLTISDDCETDDDGNAEYRARMAVHLQQQLKEVEGKQ